MAADLATRGRRAGFVLAAIAAGMLLGGFLSGGLGGDSGANATSAVGPDVGDIRVGAATAGPSDKVDGVGVGFAQTEEGAIAAATNLVLTLEQAGTADRDQAIRAYEILAAEGSRQALASDMAATWDALHQSIEDNGPMSSSLFLRTVPVGHSVTAYSSDRATIEVWTLTIVAAAGMLEPLASWETAAVDVIWEGDDWKVWSARTVDGPNPSWAEAEAEPSLVSEFLTAVDLMEGYRYVSD